MSISPVVITPKVSTYKSHNTFLSDQQSVKVVFIMWENAFTRDNFPGVVMGAIGNTWEGFECQKTALEKDVCI